MFSITNFGSLFPDPNGAKLLISLKKISFNALGAIIESKYISLVKNGILIIESFVEPGFEDNCEDDPYEMSSPQVILEYLKANEKVAI